MKKPYTWRPPSPYRMAQATAVLLAVRKRLLDEFPDIATDERLFVDMLDGEGGDAIDVLDRVIRASIHAHDMAEAASRRMEALAAREERFERREQMLRGAAFAAMEALELPALNREDFDVTVGNSGGRAVIITDEELIPESYDRISVTKDKAAIRADLLAGKHVPGAELANASPTLRIRTK